MIEGPHCYSFFDGNAAFAARKNVGNFKPSGLRPELFWNAESLYFKTPKQR